MYNVMFWDSRNHGGRDSVAWAEITVFESPVALRFFGTFRTGLETHSASYAIDTGSLSQG
jgi:hypothetical protein